MESKRLLEISVLIASLLAVYTYFSSVGETVLMALGLFLLPAAWVFCDLQKRLDAVL